jgi:phosphoglycolate phosphatase-like HAD superfamily hydrolase
METTLVLFDIDGTLLEMRGAGRRAFVRTIDHCFGWKNELKNIRFAGATDLDLFRKIAREHSHAPTPADEKKFCDRLAHELKSALGESDVVHTVFPGVPALLEKLSGDPRCLLALVTGNVETCAWIKLQLVNLREHFVLGAFGHEHADRVEIARLALRRAEERAGHPFENIFLIGDTPNDIKAAHAVGARAVAVCTGSFTRDDLLIAQADTVLDNLLDLPAVLRELGL